MRITNLTMLDHLVGNIQQSTETMDRLQNQISSGKRVTRPSDDPTAAWRGVRLREDTAANGQYLRNMDDATAWLNATDTALDGVQTTLAKIRELAVQTSNDTYNANDRAEVAGQVNELRDHLMALLNSTNHTGQYVFSGMKTSTPAFSRDAAGNVLYDGETSSITRQIGPGTTIDVNTLGSNFLSMFADVKTLADELANPQGSQATIEASIDQVDQAVEQVLTTRSDIGSKLVHVQFAQDRMNNQQVEIQRVQSDNEDVDLADVLTKLTSEQTVYQATLAAGARMSAMPNLFDFLR
jgi:flagellar hook-associated protein 3 FlgL